MSGSATCERRVVRAGDREALEQRIEPHRADGLAVVEIRETGDDDWPWEAVLEQARAQGAEGPVSPEAPEEPGSPEEAAPRGAARKRK